jgi:hypothetical protein
VVLFGTPPATEPGQLTAFDTIGGLWPKGKLADKA